MKQNITRPNEKHPCEKDFPAHAFRLNVLECNEAAKIFP